LRPKLNSTRTRKLPQVFRCFVVVNRSECIYANCVSYRRMSRDISTSPYRHIVYASRYCYRYLFQVSRKNCGRKAGDTRRSEERKHYTYIYMHCVSPRLRNLHKRGNKREFSLPQFSPCRVFLLFLYLLKDEPILAGNKIRKGGSAKWITRMKERMRAKMISACIGKWDKG
jgi:hypothetical protein